jgi:hypothetical protein
VSTALYGILGSYLRDAIQAGCAKAPACFSLSGPPGLVLLARAFKLRSGLSILVVHRTVPVDSISSFADDG